MSDKRKLTSRQELFCREYIVDLNATQAAIRAGYSIRTARFIGSENLTKPNIVARIVELQQERLQRTEVTADNVLKTISDVIEDATKDNGKGGMADRPAALKGCELLGKHLAMWTDRKVVDSNVKVSGITVVGIDNEAA